MIRDNHVPVLATCFHCKQDIGRVVILPGGEAGILKSWWNADDRREWRWQVEFYNQNRG